MKVGLGLALAILLSVGCQSTAWELSTSLDKGVAGYEGEVIPFTIPYRLRYEASPEVTQTIAATITNLDGTTNRISMLVRVKISAIGEQRLWEYIVDELAANGQKWRSSTVPLMTARGLSSSMGPLEDVELSFPGFRALGAEIPDHGYLDPASDQARRYQLRAGDGQGSRHRRRRSREGRIRTLGAQAPTLRSRSLPPPLWGWGLRRFCRYTERNCFPYTCGIAAIWGDVRGDLIPTGPGIRKRYDFRTG